MKKLTFLTILTFIFNTAFSQDIIESNNCSSFDLYKLLSKTKQNIIFSPTSIHSALAMTYTGAKGNTFLQIANAMHFNKNLNEFNSNYSSLFPNNTKESSIKLFNANSIWIEKNFKINEDFLNTNKKYYSSSLHLTDFMSKPEDSRVKINNWVKDNTNNKIIDLLEPSAIDNSTRLVLVNALYFNGTWDKKFLKKENTEENFQVGKKEYTKATYMNAKITSYYYTDKYSEIIDIPYTNNEYCLTIIIPKTYKKLKKLEKNLSYKFYENFTSNLKKAYINLSIPKFNIESEFDLEKTLASLGIKDAFNGSADFSGISESEKLYISKVIHKANIKIDENGTEATAATAVVMRKMAMQLETVDFKVNRPFIFLIRNTNTKAIYFMGRINNPNHKN